MPSWPGRTSGAAVLTWQPIVQARTGDVDVAQAQSEAGCPARLTVPDALRQGRIWSELGLRVGVRVHLPVTEPLDGALVATIEDALQEQDLAAGLLQLEVAERSLRRDSVLAVAALHDLRALGVYVVLDRLAPGSWSPARLPDWPVDELSLPAERLGRSTVEQIHARGWRCLGTQVDDLLSAARAASLGADALEGTYWGAPRSAAALTAWLLAEASARDALAAHTGTAARDTRAVPVAPAALAA
jgi:EAL domain-containing protein (putative c-di-GMP-specific phosphodiesterase class I)